MALGVNVGPRTGKKTIAVEGIGTTGTIYTVPVGKEFEGYVVTSYVTSNWKINGAIMYWAANAGSNAINPTMPYYVQLVAGDIISSNGAGGQPGTVWGQEFDAQ